jgi:hypothetical protein
MPLPARSPNLNAYAERWVRSVKQECLSKLILFGERPLRRALQQYVAHYHEERQSPGQADWLASSRKFPFLAVEDRGQRTCPGSRGQLQENCHSWICASPQYKTHQEQCILRSSLTSGPNFSVALNGQMRGTSSEPAEWADTSVVGTDK